MNCWEAKLIYKIFNRNNNLKTGKVIYKPTGKFYLIKDLPIQIPGHYGYWSYRVNVFDLEGNWKFVCHINNLENID